MACNNSTDIISKENQSTDQSINQSIRGGSSFFPRGGQINPSSTSRVAANGFFFLFFSSTSREAASRFFLGYFTSREAASRFFFGLFYEPRSGEPIFLARFTSRECGEPIRSFGYFEPP